MSGELIAELRAARERLRQVADDLAGERELGPKLAIVNPPRWEVGHVAWFQEYWCLRAACEERASILPNADRLYNSATVAHATRWDLPLPSFAETLAYRDEVGERLVSRVKAGDADPYFVRLAVRHEEGGWTFPRDVLEALEACEEVPLPARHGFWAVPGSVAVEVVIRGSRSRARGAIDQPSPEI